jgi:hypothetical protein
MLTRLSKTWQDQYNEWLPYYLTLLQPLEQGEFQADTVMETLVNDFIQRGKVLSQGRQHGLSAY